MRLFIVEVDNAMEMAGGDGEEAEVIVFGSLSAALEYVNIQVSDMGCNPQDFEVWEAFRQTLTTKVEITLA